MRGDDNMKRLLTVIFAMLLIIGNIGVASTDAASKKVSRIVIPSTYAKQHSGHPRILKLDVVYTDGSVKRITKGVKWSSSNKPVARVGKETVVAGVPGKATLTATYGGKKTSRLMTVSIPSKQSDVNWLKLHQASIFYNGNFYGNSVKIGVDTRKINGVPGGFGEPESDSNVPGKWTGPFLNTYSIANIVNPNYAVVSAWTSPKFFNRTITSQEVEKAFGRTPYVLLENIEYGFGFVNDFHKNGKTMLSFKQTTMLSYIFNNRTLELQFDEKGVLRAMSIGEKYIPAYVIENK